MSFDLCGYYPHTGEAGIGISFNNSQWGVLWRFCQRVAPEVASKLEDPFTCGGSFLDKEDAHTLATRLHADMDGHLAYWESPGSPAARHVPFLRCALPSFLEFLEASSGFILW